METVLEIDNLKKYYGRQGSQTKALDGITLQVMEGEFLGIMGSSGSGKSTLLNCIATVIEPDSGKIMMKGTEIHSLKGKKLAQYRGREIGYLFQNFELIDNLTGRENIMLPMSLHNVSDRESRKRLSRLASYLEITDVLDKFPSQMSGGQKQRVAAARAIITRPALILADEPTGALDSRSSRVLLESMELLNREENATILMVTHDAFSASYASRVIFMKDGRLFNELRRGGDDRRVFFERIMDVVSLMGGDLNYAVPSLS